MSDTMNCRNHDYEWFWWLTRPAYHSGDTPAPKSPYGDPVFRRASEGGCSLKRETQRREREMLRIARKTRREKEWREKDVERARQEAQESRGSFKTFCPRTPILSPDRLDEEIRRLERVAELMTVKDRVLERRNRLIEVRRLAQQGRNEEAAALATSDTPERKKKV